MATKAQAHKAMQAAGLSPETDLDIDPPDGYGRSAFLFAPRGKYFKSEGTHVLGVGDDNLSKVYANIVDHMSEGVGDCSSGECGSCEDEKHRRNLGAQFNGI